MKQYFWAIAIALLVLCVLGYLKKELFNRPQWRTRYVVIVLGVFSVYMGWIGLFYNPSMELSLADSIYQALALFSFSSEKAVSGVPVTLNIARFSAPLTLIALVILTFGKSFIDRMKVRLFYKNHVIVCGLGGKGLRFARSINDKKDKVVVIEINPHNDEISRIRDEGIIVIVGNATDLHVLLDAGISNASNIIGVTGNDDVNIEIAAKAHQYKTNQSKDDIKILYCYVELQDTNKQKIFRRHQLFGTLKSNFDGRIIDINNIGMRNILNSYPPDQYAVGKFGREYLFEEPVVIAVAGEGTMCIAMLKQICALCHYPNMQKNVVHVLTPNQDNLQAQILNEIPVIRNLIDLVICDIRDQEKVLGLKKLSILYICFDDHIQGYRYLMQALQQEIDKHAKVLLAIPQYSTLSDLLQESDLTEKFKNQVTFYQLYDQICNDSIIKGGNSDELAGEFHKDYCEKHDKQSLNRNTVPWESLEEEIRDSNRNQVEHMHIKLRVYGIDEELTEEQVEILAHMEHNRWYAEKRLEGYVLGHRDDDRRIHSLLVPWKELSKDDKFYNLEGVIAQRQLWRKSKDEGIVKSEIEKLSQDKQVTPRRQTISM